jgi:hypothetical protein
VSPPPPLRTETYPDSETFCYLEYRTVEPQNTELRRCVKYIYVVGHERTSSLLFVSDGSVARMLVIFVCGHVTFSIPCKGDGLR